MRVIASTCLFLHAIHFFVHIFIDKISFRQVIHLYTLFCKTVNISVITSSFELSPEATFCRLLVNNKRWGPEMTSTVDQQTNFNSYNFRNETNNLSQGALSCWKSNLFPCHMLVLCILLAFNALDVLSISFQVSRTILIKKTMNQHKKLFLFHCPNISNKYKNFLLLESCTVDMW